MKKNDVKESLSQKVELEAAKEEELVTLEMTPEQRDEVVKILADQAINKKAEESRGLYEMDLVFAHWINGKQYGPGRKVKVPEGIEGKLEDQENKYRLHEMKLLVSDTKQFEVLQGGGSRPVKVK